MSVPAKLNDASILRKFELSKKEESLKSKLFGKKTTEKPPTPTKTTRGASKSSTNPNVENNNPNIPNQTSSGTVYMPIIQPGDDQIEKFLSNMESEFKELNKKQVTMGMLNSQQQILKDHTEVLNDNQRNITQLLSIKMKEQENKKKGSSSESIELQRELLKEMIAPINSQIVEIRQLYEQTRQKADAAAREVANTRNLRDPSHQQLNEQEIFEINSKMKDYQSSSTDLKEKALNAQARLSNLLPENLHAIKQISNLNIQAYSDCINSLKKQLEHLQKDADKAERELELRYQKLNAMPKPTPKLKPNDPFYHVVEHGHEGSADIVKNLQNIDFQASKKAILTKLGGEFDYEGFIDDINSVSGEIRDIRANLESDLQQYSIIIPSDIGLSEEDKLAMDLGAQIPSVIDEIKARYRISKKVPTAQQFFEQPEARNAFKSQLVSDEALNTQSTQRENIQPLFGVKSKRIHQKPEALLNIKTKPIEPPPDIKFTKVEVRQPSANKANYADTIFSMNPPANKKQQREIQARGSPEGEDVEEEEGLPTKQNFQNANAGPDRTTQTGFRANQLENEKVSPQKTGQNQFKSQKVRFNELEDEHDTVRVLISSAKKDERAEPPVLHYQRTHETAQNQIYDDFIDQTILRDIKEEIVRINQKINEDDEHESQIGRSRGQAQQRERSLGRETHSKESEPVYFGQKFDVRPSPVLGGGITSNELPGRLGLHFDENLPIEDEQLIKKITSSVLNEKLREIIAEEKKKDDQLKENIFKPVEGVSIRDLLHSKNQEKEDQIGRNRAQAPHNIADNKELSNLLAENMLNLFTNAIQHINTSLVKNLTIAQARDESPHKSIQELFGRKKESTVAISDTRNKVSIEEEEERKGVRRDGRKENMREDETTLSKLALESKRTLEERELLKQHKPFNVEYFAEKPRERVAVPSNADYFYFHNHEPKPIADYSDYCKELESEPSSFGVDTIRSANRNGRNAWETGSEGAYRSEGFSGNDAQSDIEF